MLYLIPFISAAIGWVTNYVAIKMLFYPRKEKNYLLFRFQGIFPKRQKVLAQKLGEIVANKLFSTAMIREKIDNAQTREEIKRTIDLEVSIYLREKIKNNLPVVGELFLSEKRFEQVKDIVCGELDQFIPRIMNEFTKKVDQVDIQQIVFDKVSQFSSEKLEDLLMGVLRKELKFIELAGAVLGFFIGVGQVALLIFF